MMPCSPIRLAGMLASLASIAALSLPLCAAAPRGAEGECGFVEDYGDGCPTLDGAIPVLSVTSPCLEPLGTLTLDVATGPGEKLAFLVAGAAHFTVDLTPSCFLQVGEFFPWTLPLAIPASGRISLTSVLPRDSFGATFFVQVVVLDAAAPYGVAATNPRGIYVVR